MEFWKGNRADAGFEMPAAEVADKFMEWARSEGAGPEMLAGLPLERVIRYWLTATEHFNSVWESEHGPESFDHLYEEVHNRAYGGTKGDDHDDSVC